MATLNIDLVSDLGSVEQDGIVQQLRRKAILSDLSNTNSDAQTLNEVLTALNSAGYTAYSTPTGYSNLMLTRRSPVMVSPTIAEVTLEYTPIAQSGIYFHWTGSSNLSSITSQVDAYGMPIEVSHTYLGDDIYGRGGITDTQGAEISVPSPSMQLVGTGLATSSNPVVTAAKYINKVNSRTWWGVAPGWWLCTGAQFDPFDVSTTPKQYRWTFSFELNSVIHTPRVYYIDPQTNRVPEGLVAGVGSKYATWQTGLDFNADFPT